jgi:hypothetical protein
MAYHYTLIRERDRPKCFKAFLHNNWVGAAIFAGWVVDYLLRGGFSARRAGVAGRCAAAG